MKTSKVFSTKLASEEALNVVLSYTGIASVRMAGYSGLGLEASIGEEDTITHVGWWEEGMSLMEAISPEFREEVLPEDPAYQKFMNTPSSNDGETYTHLSVVREMVGGVPIAYKRLFNSSCCGLENAGLVVPHLSRKEVEAENEAARRAALSKYYEERGEVLL